MVRRDAREAMGMLEKLTGRKRLLSTKTKWQIANLLNRNFLYDQGMQIKKVQKPLENRLQSGRYIERQRMEMALMAKEFFSRIVGGSEENSVEQFLIWIEEYDHVSRNSPFVENSGGSQYNDAIWLYLSAKILAPKQIVECGTFKGFSLWLLHQAQKDAKLSTFDINLDLLQRRVEGADYHLADWSEVEIRAADENDLCFFDDHFDQATRVIEAANRGFRYAIFDDSYAVQAVYRTGLPPIPSIPMLYDDFICDGEVLEWYRNGKKKKHTFDLALHEAARSRIERWSFFPEFNDFNRYGIHSGLCFVELKP